MSLEGPANPPALGNPRLMQAAGLSYTKLSSVLLWQGQKQREEKKTHRLAPLKGQNQRTSRPDPLCIAAAVVQPSPATQTQESAPSKS